MWVGAKFATPRLINSFLFAPCKGACFTELAAGRRCVCENASLVSDGARCHIPALPAWGNTPGWSTQNVFWRALGQSAQAEQDNSILYISQESVVQYLYKRSHNRLMNINTQSAGPPSCTRDERPGERALEEWSCGTYARGQRVRQRQRGLREAGAWSASEKRSFSELQLTGLWLARKNRRAKGLERRWENSN